MDHVATAPRPLIALAMGDPAGISPELTARLLADPEIRAEVALIAIGDLRILAEGAAVAGVDPDVEVWYGTSRRQPRARSSSISATSIPALSVSA